MAEVGGDPPQIADGGQPDDSAHEPRPPSSRISDAAGGDPRPVCPLHAIRHTCAPWTGDPSPSSVPVGGRVSAGSSRHRAPERTVDPVVVRTPRGRPSAVTATRPLSPRSRSARASSRLAPASIAATGTACSTAVPAPVHGSTTTEPSGEIDVGDERGRRRVARRARSRHRQRARSAPTTGAGSTSSTEIAVTCRRLSARIATDEVGDERRGRLSEDVRRRVVLLEVRAHVEQRDPRAHLHGLVDVVRDEHDRLPELGLKPQELVLEARARHRVDRAERLVHQQHRRIGGERARDTDALALTARRAARGSGRGTPRFEADRREQLVGPRRRSRRLSQPSSRGTVATLRAIVWCGNRPTCWIT